MSDKHRALKSVLSVRAEYDIRLVYSYDKKKSPGNGQAICAEKKNLSEQAFPRGMHYTKFLKNKEALGKEKCLDNFTPGYLRTGYMKEQ